MVAAADAVEPGLLGLDRLLKQVVRRKPLVRQRYVVRNLAGLVLARPTNGSDRREDSHFVRALPTTDGSKR